MSTPDQIHKARKEVYDASSNALVSVIKYVDADEQRRKKNATPADSFEFEKWAAKLPEDLKALEAKLATARALGIGGTSSADAIIEGPNGLEDIKPEDVVISAAKATQRAAKEQTPPAIEYAKRLNEQAKNEVSKKPPNKIDVVTTPVIAPPPTAPAKTGEVKPVGPQDYFVGGRNRDIDPMHRAADNVSAQPLYPITPAATAIAARQADNLNNRNIYQEHTEGGFGGVQVGALGSPQVQISGQEQSGMMQLPKMETEDMRQQVRNAGLTMDMEEFNRLAKVKARHGEELKMEDLARVWWQDVLLRGVGIERIMYAEPWMRPYIAQQFQMQGSGVFDELAAWYAPQLVQGIASLMDSWSKGNITIQPPPGYLPRLPWHPAQPATEQ